MPSPFRALAPAAVWAASALALGGPSGGGPAAFGGSGWSGGSRALDRAVELDAAARATTRLTGDAGHDGKFFIASGDGDARLSMSGAMQFRYVANLNPEDERTGEQEFSNGFQFRRLRLGLTGSFDRAGVDFKLLSEFARGDGVLLDAFATKSLDEGVWTLVGQHEVGYSREVGVASSKQLAIDRSLVEEVFGLDRSTGVAIGLDRERWRLRGTISDGRRASNTGFDSALGADLALTARGEVRIGDASWKQFEDLTAFRGSTRGLLLGAGVHWQRDGRIPDPGIPGGDDTMFGATLDASYEDDGWNAMIAAHARSITTGGLDTLDWGLVAQGGVFVTERAEAYARFVQLWPDPDRDDSDPFSTIALGGTHYFIPASHAAKLSIEGMLLLSDPASSASLVLTPNASQGILGGTESGQVVLTAQMQLLF